MKTLTDFVGIFYRHGDKQLYCEYKADSTGNLIVVQKEGEVISLAVAGETFQVMNWHKITLITFDEANYNMLKQIM